MAFYGETALRLPVELWRIATAFEKLYRAFQR